MESGNNNIEPDCNTGNVEPGNNSTTVDNLLFYLSGNSSNKDITSSYANRQIEGNISYGGLYREADTSEMREANSAWPEDHAVEEPKPIEDMSKEEIDNELNRLSNMSSLNLTDIDAQIQKLIKRKKYLEQQSVKVEVQDSHDQNFINPAQMVSVDNLILKPFETWFTTEIKDERMILTSVKLNKKFFENVAPLKNVKTAKITITHLHIEDQAIIKHLEEYFSIINKIEEIVFDFRGLKEEAAFYNRVPAQIKGIIETVLKYPSLGKIQVYWDFQVGAEALVNAISDRFLDPVTGTTLNTLKWLSIFIKTKISAKSFHDLVERLQVIQQNLTVFEFEANLEPPEESSLTKLSLPKAKKFTLNLHCSGQFSDQLVTFAEESLSSMTVLEDLDLKLMIKDFSGADIEAKLTGLLPKTETNPNLVSLIFIVSLGKENDLERLLKVVVKNLAIQKLKSIKIGVDPANFIEKKTKAKISEFWKQKKQEFNL